VDVGSVQYDAVRVWRGGIEHLLDKKYRIVPVPFDKLAKRVKLGHLV
jgi:hypothetical protein